MDLFEYQGKQYFARYGIPVSPAASPTPSTTPSPRPRAAGYPVVVKAQVQVGGRGKAGGIKLANNADEVREHAGNILGMDIKGHVVHGVWVEHASDIAEEYYASFTLDRGGQEAPRHGVGARAASRSSRSPRRTPTRSPSIHVDPVDGLTEAAARELVERGQARTRRPPTARSTSC